MSLWLLSIRHLFRWQSRINKLVKTLRVKKIFAQTFFLTKVFLWPKTFLDKKNFDQNFLDKKLFWIRSFYNWRNCDENWSWTKEIFFETEFFWGGPKFFLDLKFIFGPDFFLDPNFFLDPKCFLTQNKELTLFPKPKLLVKYK